jgi:probable rRNA maturation factor
MIVFNNIDHKYTLKQIAATRQWLINSITQEGKEIAYIGINFCSDVYLLNLNIKALKHNYYTDIITFELNSKNEPIEGDIYISIDRVKENAKGLGVPMGEELLRVMIHGILHLCGYGDRTKTEQKKMREKENYYLSIVKVSRETLNK